MCVVMRWHGASRGFSDLGLQSLEQRLDPSSRDVAHDENEAAAAVLGRPAIEPGGRMEDVLHAVDHGGPVGALGDVDDALQAQEIAAAVLGQNLRAAASA